jgi:hypothetical protein
MLRRVALVRTDVLEELSASIKTLYAAAGVPSSPIFITLMMEVPSSSETSVLTSAILHSHSQEILKSYTILDM